MILVSSNSTKLALGSSQVSKMYLGSTQIYSKDPSLKIASFLTSVNSPVVSDSGTYVPSMGSSLNKSSYLHFGTTDDFLNLVSGSSLVICFSLTSADAPYLYGSSTRRFNYYKVEQNVWASTDSTVIPGASSSCIHISSSKISMNTPYYYVLDHSAGSASILDEEGTVISSGTAANWVDAALERSEGSIMLGGLNTTYYEYTSSGGVTNTGKLATLSGTIDLFKSYVEDSSGVKTYFAEIS